MRILFNNLTSYRISKKRILQVLYFLGKKYSKHKVLRKKLSCNLEIEDLSVVFVSPLISKRVNFQFRKKNYATDVLSFGAEEDHLGLGELVMCPQVLKKQAKEHGHSMAREIDLMLVHGFLHLLGYDHEKSLKDERQMMKIQEKLFKKITDA